MNELEKRGDEMRHLRKSYGIRGQKTMDERIEQSNFYEDMFPAGKRGADTERAEEKDGRREKYRNREKERKIIASIAMSLDHHFNC